MVRRVRSRVGGVVDSVAGWFAQFAAPALRPVWQASGWVAAVCAAALFVWQPDRHAVDPTLILTIATLPGLALSVGAAVTLLIAQHTAERHSRQIYREFRRDPSWIIVIGLAASSVVATVAAGLQFPTVSTTWASLILLVAVLLVSAAQLPTLLDSLDPATLATRFGKRMARRVSSVHQGHDHDDQVAGATRSGVESLFAVARGGLRSEDPEVVTAALASVHDLLVAYLQSIALPGIDDLTADFAMQRYEVLAQAARAYSPVVVLPSIVDALRDLGVAASRLRIPLNPDWEPISLRVSSILLEIAAASLGDQISSSGGMATAAIAECAEALVVNHRPRLVGEHIRKLRSIGVSATGAGAFHVAAQASHGLARLAARLIDIDGQDIMEGAHFEDAANALLAIGETYRDIKTGSWGIADSAVLLVIGPMATPNVASLAVGGLFRRSTGSDRGFRDGASTFFSVAIELAFPPKRRVLIAADARQASYAAIAGALARATSPEDFETLEAWWRLFVPRLIAATGSGEGGGLDDRSLLTGLLLFVIYKLPAIDDDARDILTNLVGESLAQSFAPGAPGARLAAVWRTVGVASIGAGLSDLAVSIARVTGLQPGDDEGHPWRRPPTFHVNPLWADSFHPPYLLPGVPAPPWRLDHEDPSNRHKMEELCLAAGTSDLI